MHDPTCNIAHWVAQRARSAGRWPALCDAERRLDYAGLDARCQRAAGVLQGRGVGPGDRVALLLANRTAYLEAVLGAARIGAIAVPLNTRLAAPELAQLLDDCRPALLLHEAELAPLAEAALAAAGRGRAPAIAVGGAPCAWEAALAGVEPVPGVRAQSGEEPVILMYTSGTTGTPKGALLPHRKTLYNSLNAMHFFDLTRHDRVLTVVPLFHSFGLKILALPALYAGATVYLMRRFDPEALWDTVERERITYFGGVPTLFQALEENLARSPRSADALRSLRFLFTAGAAIPVPLIHAFEARGLCLKQGFGQTETSILCCLDAEDAVRKAGSVGQPVLHAEVRIVDPEGFAGPPEGWRDCAPGETGEIVVRGPITMLGYWERPEATAETLRSGWLRTGDLASFDAEGFVTLTGRSKDLYISGGENVYPRQVEAVYEEHPEVREIAVVGTPDDRWGEVGTAYVVPVAGARLDAEALRDWGRERLAAFKVPARFVAVAELPRTASGKVQKFRLLEEAGGGGG